MCPDIIKTHHSSLLGEAAFSLLHRLIVHVNDSGIYINVIIALEEASPGPIDYFRVLQVLSMFCGKNT